MAGQTLSLVVVNLMLGFPLPLVPCLMAVGLSVVVNLLLRVRFPVARRLGDISAGPLLAYDVLQLTALLYLTGGLSNPSLCSIWRR